MFKGKNKIIAFTLAILLVLVSLTSISFSTKVSKVSGSFACTTNVAKVDSKTEVVEAVADIAVMALTADLVGDIEERLESRTVEIYKARQAAEKAAEEARAKAEAEAIAAEKAAREAAKSEATSTVTSGTNLNGPEAEILRLINSVRADHGLGQLTVVQSLTDIARTRCSDMVSRGYFSHYAPDGSTFFNIMRNSGISWSNAGENLGNATPASYGSPSAFINAWMGSPSHRDNMLKGNYRLVGVGVVDGGGRRVVATIFLN
ncbi:CAP domain-containing protein [Actinomycetota bacterium]